MKRGLYVSSKGKFFLISDVRTYEDLFQVFHIVTFEDETGKHKGVLIMDDVARKLQRIDHYVPVADPFVIAKSNWAEV